MKNRKLWVLCGAVCLSLLLLLACASPGATPTGPTPTAKPPATTPGQAGLFVGKTLTIVLPNAAGGGSDILGRVYSKFLPKYLPGNPGMIVRNIPGGGNTIGANFVYSSKPDGLTTLLDGGSTALFALVGASAVKYDLVKMPLISAVGAGSMFFVSKRVLSKSEDLPNAKGLIFGYSTGSGAWLFIASKELLNIPTEKVILAYSGSGDSRRAFLAGEINMSYETTTGYNEAVAPLVKSGEVLPLFQTGLLDDKGKIVKSSAVPPDVPTLVELYEKVNGKAPSGMAWDAYKGVAAAVVNQSKHFFLPPGTPDAAVRAYWDAFGKMLKDAEFRKIVDPMVGEDALWGWGEAYEKDFRQSFAMKPEIVNWFRPLLTKYGVAVD